MEADEEQTQYPRNSISTIASSFSLQGSSVQAHSRGPSRASVYTIDTIYSQSSAPRTPNLRAHPFGRVQCHASTACNAYNNWSQLRHEPELEVQHQQTPGHPTPLAGVPHDGPYSAAQGAASHTKSTGLASTGTNSRGVCQHLGCGVVFKSKSHESQHKKTHNDYACPQCGVTFGKKSDRRTHVNESCKKLGSGSRAWKCLHPGCEQILRTEFQVKEHQKEDGHADSGVEEIYGLVRPRYTCSNDGQIYRSLHDFMNHFNNPKCALNKFSTHKRLHHHERIHTLLQEGRDDVNGQHDYIYAELLQFCHESGLPPTAWEHVVNKHTATDAQDIASKLEWGLVLNDGSDLSRLGFVDLTGMVRFIMSPLLPQDNALDAPNYFNGAPLQLLDRTSDFITPDTAFLTQESRKDFVRRPSTARADLHLPEAHTGLSTPNRPVEETFQVQDVCMSLGQSTSGFHINATKPLPVPDVSANTITNALQDPAISNSRLNFTFAAKKVVDDPAWSREKQAAFERDWCGNVTPADEGYWSQSYLNHASCAVSKEMCSPPSPPPSAATNFEGAIPEDQDLPIQLSVGAHGPKSKRPISTNSAYHPEAAARRHLFRSKPLPIRQSSTQLQSSHDPGEHARTSGSSQRTSDASVSDYFQWAEYYRTSDNGSTSQPKKQSLTVTMRQGVADPAPSQYFVPKTSPTAEQTSPERPKTPGGKVKAMLHKLLSPTIRELDDLPENERSAFVRQSPQSLQNSLTTGLPCTTCGKTGDPSCFSGHVDLQKTIKSRRTGGTFTLSDGIYYVAEGDALDVQSGPNASHAFDDYDPDEWMR